MGIWGKLKGAFSSSNSGDFAGYHKLGPEAEGSGYEDLREYYVLTSPRGAKGEFIEEQWRLGGPNEPSHREYGPAFTVRHKATGKVVTERYMVNGEAHRENGPAIIKIDFETGVVTREEYLQNNHHHRIDGPAIIHRDNQTGEVTLARYFVNGLEDSTLGINHSLS